MYKRQGNNTLAITANNLNLNLSAGTYWFGLTAVASSSLQQEFHYSAGSQVGQETQFRNPEGGFGLGTDWGNASVLGPDFLDASLTICGEDLAGGSCSVPEPSSAILVTTLAAGLGLRRKRMN